MRTIKDLVDLITRLTESVKYQDRFLKACREVRENRRGCVRNQQK